MPESPRSTFGYETERGELGLLDLASRIEWDNGLPAVDVRDRRGTWRIVDSSSDEEESATGNNVILSSLVEASGLPDRWVEALAVVRDTSGQEKIPLMTGVTRKKYMYMPGSPSGFWRWSWTMLPPLVWRSTRRRCSSSA